ncbi:MAG: polyphosphate:AMP phosphotransferase [Methylophilaceae bacterium]
MFESAELGHHISKEKYELALPLLRKALLDVQYKLLELKSFPVILLISGVDGAGKGETANILNEWMDARHIHTYAFAPPSQDELAKPPMWRFWQALPPKGEIGIFFGSWYTEPIVRKSYGEIKTSELDNAMNDIVRFEQMLTEEGALVIKLWFHLSKDAQKNRIKALKKDPKTRWRVSKQDIKHLKLYDRFRRIAGRVLKETSTANAPWMVIEGTDPNYRNLTTGEYLLETLQSRISQHKKKTPKPEAPPLLKPIDKLRILDTLDLSKQLDKETYNNQLEHYQGKLNQLSRHPKFKKMALVLAFEGVDAAGKGGAIRRVTQALDARIYNVTPISAPSDEEHAQPYLWRFWRKIPAKAHVAIFDRSWYGRVLVERVEKFCSQYDWLRAYAEINDFEEQLSKHDVLVLKFWLQITQEEQLARFTARKESAYKQFKITPDDWRNRKKWNAYKLAAADMIERTSSVVAPWHLIEANDKNYARIKILRTLCEKIEEKLARL